MRNSVGDGLSDLGFFAAFAVVAAFTLPSQTIPATHVRPSDPAITAGAATGLTVIDTGDLRGRLVYQATVAAAAFVCADVTCDVTVATLPAGMKLLGLYADLTETFACTATCTSSTLSLTVGSSAGGTDLLVSFDADAATATVGDADADLGTGLNRANAIQGGFLGSWSSTTPISLRLTSGTGNIGNGTATNLSQGSLTLYVETVAVK
jgi:hypothetical protein